MKLNYLVILGTMTLSFGCTGQAEVSQPLANSPINTASPTGKQSSNTAKTIKSGTFVAGEHYYRQRSHF